MNATRRRVWAVNGLLVAALALFVVLTNRHTPLKDWLFFLFLRSWAASALFAASALAAGLAIDRRFRLLPAGATLSERLTLAFALGVLVFVWGVFLGGVLGLFGRAFFFLWPALLLALGARPLWQLGRRLTRHLNARGLSVYAVLAPRGAIECAGAALVVLSLAAIYLHVITPINIGADAHWYHLPIAEHYAVEGRIRAFPEGWYLGAYPQLASLLYTWGFLAPGALHHHTSLASHLEWTLLLATLVGVHALVRRLLLATSVRRRAPYALAVFFLFPGIFLYDSSLLTMADHVLGFWAPPLALSLIALARAFTVRRASVAGLLTAAVLLTKYQGIYCLGPVAIVLGFAAIAHRRTGLFRPLAAFAAALVVGSSLHWLKNAIFYHDPLYPLLHRFFPSRPFSPRAAEILAGSYFPPQFSLQGATIWHKVARTARALVDFSFVPNNWGFHRNRPVYGSLFTLVLPALFFLRPPRRLLGVVLAAHVALATWYVTSHQDRFLQSLTPIFAATTAVALILLWQHRLARAPAAALVVFQIAACADIYFLRSHAMIGDAPLKPAVDYIAAGHAGETQNRHHLWGTLEDIGRALPPGATLLTHEYVERLGLGVPVVADRTEWQGRIDYLALPNPHLVFELWKDLGVTHVSFRPDRGDLSVPLLAREAVFMTSLEVYGRDRREIGGYGLASLTELPRARAPKAPFEIAWLGCDFDPPLGLYTPAGLADYKPTRELGPVELASSPEAVLAKTDALIWRPSCTGFEAAKAAIERDFRKVTTAGDVAVWVRRLTAAEPAKPE